MSRRGVGVAAAVALAAVAVGAVVTWTVRDGDGSGHHALVRYDDEHGIENRYVDLPDGDAQLSVGSPDRHRIVVQWRDPDGRSWSEPEIVWNDEQMTAIDNTVRYGGGTVAIRQMYTPDVHSDSDIGSVNVGIVCRDGSCTARQGGGGSEAQVTPDGSSVLLAQTEKGVLLWTAEEGIRLASWSGHPGFEYGVVSPSEPVLAPDGSLRVVTSEPTRGSCTFDLLVGAPGTADLTTAATTTEPLHGRAVSDCASYLETLSPDWVAVHPSDHRAADFWFVRAGDTWTTTRDDPSGLEVVDVDRGCCDSSVIGFVHWNSVAYGSPDGHRIQVQTHVLGDEAWSEPELLDGAPAGYRCTWMESYEVGAAGLAVLMTCGDAYAVAATPDLHTWESAFVTDVDQDPEVDDDQVRVGDTTWTPEDGFATR